MRCTPFAVMVSLLDLWGDKEEGCVVVIAREEDDSQHATSNVMYMCPSPSLPSPPSPLLPTHDATPHRATNNGCGTMRENATLIYMRASSLSVWDTATREP